MFSEDSKKKLTIAKWIVGIVSACILVYLGIRYIHVIVDSIRWLIELILPILLGIIFALILNIPLYFFENKLFTKIIPVKSQSIKRGLSILFSLLSIIAVIILALFLVIPELVQAIITLINIGRNSVEAVSSFTESLDYSTLPFGDVLKKINIDWASLAAWLEDLLPTFVENFASAVPQAVSSSLGIFIDIFLGIIFSIYILFKKEILKRQTGYMLHVWVPEKAANVTIHIADVCSQCFRNFIVGQTTEALILGTLCTVGMAILRLPYAPTIGVLVGVTAFIPYIGAYIGAIVGFVMILTINPFKAVVFVIFLLILQQIEGNVIYPKVVGNRINLPSIWVLAGLTIGGNLAGPIGMILGVPAFSAAYKLTIEATKKRKEKLDLCGNEEKNNEK